MGADTVINAAPIHAAENRSAPMAFSVRIS
jgi:hypothetical protein